MDRFHGPKKPASSPSAPTPASERAFDSAFDKEEQGLEVTS
jgi:hypothetical protein